MEKRLISVFGLICLMIAGAGAIVALEGQTPGHPDFSGVWNLNLKESLLQIPPPDSGIFRIEHKDPVFHLSRTFVRAGREDTWEIEITTDGKEAVQEGKTETFRGRLTWQGDDLFLDSTISIGARTATNKVAYHLSNDGRRLTATESFRGPRLKYDNVWVFDKE
ncbi:MAG: hypothetical protein A2Y86_01795 [Candidatus Aminicenantes bacterium RBG_13_62_12]|nr:MAG: hypothetical protein A2Y86_01795 [Candidatus Aminicenantes bacterium RBG_13_62_12]